MSDLHASLFEAVKRMAAQRRAVSRAQIMECERRRFAELKERRELRAKSTDMSDLNAKLLEAIKQRAAQRRRFVPAAVFWEADRQRCAELEERRKLRECNVAATARAAARAPATPALPSNPRLRD